jgi:tRNA threonylcarbamoyladenosine biosynthesis protein TsaE
MMRVEIVSSSPEQTQAIGRVLGARAQPGDVVLLSGELGAGKTCLTQGVLWGLGVDEFARSPTFVMINEYEGRLPLYHIDLYRIDAEVEVADLGLDEYLSGDGICVVEWPERSRDAYPLERVEIKLEHVNESTRKLTLTSASRRFDAVFQAAKSAATAG